MRAETSFSIIPSPDKLRLCGDTMILVAWHMPVWTSPGAKQYMPSSDDLCHCWCSLSSGVLPRHRRCWPAWPSFTGSCPGSCSAS